MNSFLWTKQMIVGLLLAGVGSVSSSKAQQTASIPEIEPASVTDDEFRLALDEETAKEVNDLILKLGSVTPVDRDYATKRLLDIGAQAFQELRECYNSTDDFEVRLRIERIVHEAFENHHVFKRMGYLGIGLDRKVPFRNTADDPRVPPNHVGIVLGQVNKNTGAMRAGLQVGDMIIMLDGKPLANRGNNTWKWFASTIQAVGPGGKIVLTVCRDESELEITVVLGQPPRQPSMGIQNLAGKRAEARGRFSIWWSKFFVHNDDSTIRYQDARKP